MSDRTRLQYSLSTLFIATVVVAASLSAPTAPHIIE